MAHNRITFLIVDLACAFILHLVRQDIDKRKEIQKMEAIKKNDELHELKKADDRALKSSNMDRDRKGRAQHNSRGSYKTHEKRNHNPPQHNIQQPMKWMKGLIVIVE